MDNFLFVFKRFKEPAEDSTKHLFDNPTRNIEDDFMREIYHEIDRDCGIRDYDCITYCGFLRTCECGQEYFVDKNNPPTKERCHGCVRYGRRYTFKSRRTIPG